jgi:hypothetical protein
MQTKFHVSNYWKTASFILRTLSLRLAVPWGSFLIMALLVCIVMSLFIPGPRVPCNPLC